MVGRDETTIGQGCQAGTLIAVPLMGLCVCQCCEL